MSPWFQTEEDTEREEVFDERKAPMIRVTRCIIRVVIFGVERGGVREENRFCRVDDSCRLFQDFEGFVGCCSVLFFISMLVLRFILVSFVSSVLPFACLQMPSVMFLQPERRKTTNE